MNANEFMNTVTLNQYDTSELMYCYLLTNISNNKSYVGITNNPKRRWADHKYCTTDNAYKDKPLYRAIIKYSSDAFNIKILSTNETRKDISLDEIKYIEEYNTFIYPNRQGYNLTKGGENGFESRPITDEARKKMSESQKASNGVKYLEKFHKENPDFASENITKQWQIPGFRESRSGKNHWASKPVVIFGIKYISIADAAVKLNKSEGYPRYHVIPSKWNNWDPKKHSNSYFITTNEKENKCY